jgi:hypothetical protein
MKKLFFLYLIAPLSGIAQTEKHVILPTETQIKIAVLAAPEDLREKAAVLGYNQQGELTELRKGTNGFICLAPDYKTPKFYAAHCYPESLEPFMKRGRDLIEEGKRRERDEIRGKEHAAGELYIPQQPSTLFVYWGSLEKLNHETGEMSDGKRRYVIYVPFALAKDLGMSNQPNPFGMPWLMNEGTYKAHIMITPPFDHEH